MGKQKNRLSMRGWQFPLLGAFVLLLIFGDVTLVQSQKWPSNMRAAIRKAIMTLPNYGVFDDLSFDIQESTVILRGFASRPSLKESAGQAVKKVQGVEKVVNQIEVLPLSTRDDDVRADLYANIYGDTALARFGPTRATHHIPSIAREGFGITNDPPIGYHAIHIIVKDGHVTLAGMVNTPGDSLIAETRARGTSGVFSVTNDLMVSSEVKE
jgi:hypothetical protein